MIVHLREPAEKLFGCLLALSDVGLSLRGIGLASFDDWLRELGEEEPSALGPATLFVPLHRVERIFLDEPIGPLPSYGQRLAARAGREARQILGLE